MLVACDSAARVARSCAICPGACVSGGSAEGSAGVGGIWFGVLPVCAAAARQQPSNTVPSVKVFMRILLDEDVQCRTRAIPAALYHRPTRTAHHSTCGSFC